jgi:hypothetical protein
MINDPIDKFHCYGNDEIFRESFCEEEKCRFLTACNVLCGNHVQCKQWELIDKIHHNMTVSEVMETLQLNYMISYNAAKMSIKRWRKRNGNM